VLCLAAQNRSHCQQCDLAGAFGCDSVSRSEQSATSPQRVLHLAAFQGSLSALGKRAPLSSPLAPEPAGGGTGGTGYIRFPGDGGISVLRNLSWQPPDTAVEDIRSRTGDTAVCPTLRCRTLCSPSVSLLPVTGIQEPRLICCPVPPTPGTLATCTYTARRPVLCLARRLLSRLASLARYYSPSSVDAWRASCNHTLARQASSLERPAIFSPPWTPETRRS
jgi:hypothetical protein